MRGAQIAVDHGTAHRARIPIHPARKRGICCPSKKEEPTSAGSIVHIGLKVEQLLGGDKTKDPFKIKATRRLN